MVRKKRKKAKMTGGRGGKGPKFKGKIMSGQTFGVVELLDPSDSNYFRRKMKEKGMRELTPPVKGNTFRSKAPTEEWMKKVADLDPDWWYISGHFSRVPSVDEKFFFNACFFNKTFYDKVFHGAYDQSSVSRVVNEGGESFVQVDPPSFHIRMEYETKRDDLKQGNFFEKYGKGTYPKAKVVLAVGCNTLVFPLVRKFFSELFPNAIILGHINKNPGNATPIIRNFLVRYLGKKFKDFDWEHQKHIISSWLSYHDRGEAKNSIMKRGYGLAAYHGGKVYGVDVDKRYLTPPGKDAAGGRIWNIFANDSQVATVLRYRLKSVSKLGRGRLIDVLIVGNSAQIFVHEGVYQGDKEISLFELTSPFANPDSFPFLSPSNLARYRGY